MEIRKLNELKATNSYLRLGTDVTDLEKSIGTLGLIAPLVISPDNVILAGARRYQALLNLGFTEVPVIVIEKGILEKELVSIDENLVRKDLNKMEIEGHLRRALEIYQKLNPTVIESGPPKNVENKTVLASEKFLNIVSEKTGLSAKQIHEAINRDGMSSNTVKEARKKGELSLSQTNEIVKLNKNEQTNALAHLKSMPVREIKNFIKIAKSKGLEEAIKETPHKPFEREFLEIESQLKKLVKKFRQFELEGIEFSDLPSSTKELLTALQNFSHSIPNNNSGSNYEESYSQ